MECDTEWRVAGTEYGEVRYKAFGDQRYASGTTPTTFRFTGQRAEQSLGIYYYGARWYDSYLNRWIQPDTIIPNPSNPLDYDRYAYSRNNPVNLVDPTGHEPCPPKLCGYTVDGDDGWVNPFSYPDVPVEMMGDFSSIQNTMEFVASVAFEPVDWALTVRDCLQGECSIPVVLLTVIPLLPARAGNLIDALPAPGTLSNVDARKWYLAQDAKIPGLIDPTLSLEERARQAFELRNQFRTQARELMADRELAERLALTDPNLTWDQVVQKAMNQGKSGDDIYYYIIESSQRSRLSVNSDLGLLAK